MTIYSYSMNVSGTSPAIVSASQTNKFQMFAKLPENDVFGNGTFQVVTTSAATGRIEITLDRTNYASIYPFTTTSASSSATVFPGKFQDFRMVLTSTNGTVTVLGAI